jgi:hypothetical protein
MGPGLQLSCQMELSADNQNGRGGGRRVARFFLVREAKMETVYQTDHKMYQKAIKYTECS